MTLCNVNHPYNDDCLAVVGRYKYVKLSHIPFEYLAEFAKTNKDHRLMEYLNAKNTKGNEAESLGAPKCETGKILFLSKKNAMDYLHFIKEKNDGRKKPIRAYECQKCGNWHLTSKPHIKFQNNA